VSHKFVVKSILAPWGEVQIEDLLPRLDNIARDFHGDGHYTRRNVSTTMRRLGW